MRKKYKQSKINEENKYEYKTIEIPKNTQINPKNNLDEKKESFPKLSKIHLIESSQRSTISYNSKESGRYRKFYPFKREENKKAENIDKDKDNKKELNKNFKFDKKRKFELS
jgi:hypothetical protein